MKRSDASTMPQQRETEKSTTRRRFLSRVAGLASGLAAGGAVLATRTRSASSSTAADPPDPVQICKDACYDSYLDCCQGCKRHRSKVKRALCYSACFNVYVACLVGCETERVLSVMEAAAEWIADHPEVVVGTIVVIGAVTFVVVTGGSGAPVLVPALAL